MYSNVQYNKLNLCYATYHVLFQPTRKICVGFLLLFCCIDPSLCYIWPWYGILFYYHSDDCNQRVIISITCWSIHPGYFIFLLSPLWLLLLLNNQPQYIRTFTFTITISYHITMTYSIWNYTTTTTTTTTQQSTTIFTRRPLFFILEFIN